MTGATPAGSHTVRRHNLALVLHHVADGLPVTRAQLADATGLARATVSALADELIAAGLVTELDARRGGRGRPGNPLALRGDGAAGLGLEVNVGYLAACLVDLCGVVRWHRHVTGDNRGQAPSAVLRRLAGIAGAATEHARSLALPVAGGVVALPGVVDVGQLRRAANLPAWEGFSVADSLTDLLVDRPAMAFDNEANLAALAELWYGGRPGRQHFIHVSGEIGIGAGIVLAGSLFRGARGYAGELGHVSVAPDGPICSCGARGCLEQFAGQDALLAASGAATIDTLIDDAAARGPAGRVLRHAGRSIGIALSSAVNMLDIPAVVLGGLYARLGPWLVEPIADELARRVISGGWAPTQVQVSALGTDAAIRGAAGTVIRRVLADPAAALAVL